MEETEVMKKQVGGSHYKQHKGLQPWNIIDAYDLNYYEGNVLKYLLRDKTNRIEDLQKLIHYAEKELENITPVDNVDRTTSKDVHRAVNSEATEGMESLRLMQMYNAVERWLEDSTLSLTNRFENGAIRIYDSRNNGDDYIRFESYYDFFEWFVTEHPDQYLAQGGSKQHAEKMRRDNDS